MVEDGVEAEAMVEGGVVAEDSVEDAVDGGWVIHHNIHILIHHL